MQGKPVPQARPRFGKGGHVYEPKVCIEAKEKIKEAAINAMREQGFALAHKDMPIKLECWFYRPIPDSKPAWFKRAAELGLVAPTPKLFDADNVLKLCSDSINGIVFYDDAQVVEIAVHSRYSVEPRTEIEVTAYYTNIGDIKSEVARLMPKQIRSDKGTKRTKEAENDV